MTLWIVFAVMALVAAAFVARPVIKSGAIPIAVGSSVAVIVAAFLLYTDIGNPTALSVGPHSAAQSGATDLAAVTETLAARLQSEPDDIEGWKMLGRSYAALGNYREGVQALQKAVDLEGGQNAQTLVDLGESMFAASGQQLTPEIGALFENALALQPNNPSALFWSGITAANRNDIAEAADRWEKLLATNPPENIRGLIQQRVAEWRGTSAPDMGAPAPQVAQSAPAEPATTGEPQEAIAEPVEGGISLRLSVPDEVRTSLPPGTTVFVIARVPNQPGPPIAAVRRQLADLPLTVELTDSQSMIAGRVISAFEEVEVVARVSLSGRPVAESGDWFGSAVASPGDQVALSLDQQVP